MENLISLIETISIDKNEDIEDIDYFKFNDLSIELDKLEYDSWFPRTTL